MSYILKKIVDTNIDIIDYDKEILDLKRELASALLLINDLTIRITQLETSQTNKNVSDKNSDETFDNETTKLIESTQRSDHKINNNIGFYISHPLRPSLPRKVKLSNKVI